MDQHFLTKKKLSPMVKNSYVKEFSTRLNVCPYFLFRLFCSKYLSLLITTPCCHIMGYYQLAGYTSIGNFYEKFEDIH